VKGVTVLLDDKASGRRVGTVDIPSDAIADAFAGGHQGGKEADVELTQDTRIGHLRQTKEFRIFVPEVTVPTDTNSLTQEEYKNAKIAAVLGAELSAKAAADGWYPIDPLDAWHHHSYRKADIVGGVKGHWCDVMFERFIPPAPTWEELAKLGIRRERPEGMNGYNIFDQESRILSASNGEHWNLTARRRWVDDSTEYSYTGVLDNPEVDEKIRASIAAALTSK
jgi:hypothetical protein